jgi:hypothetical protein
VLQLNGLNRHPLGRPSKEMKKFSSHNVIGRYLPLDSKLDPFDIDSWQTGETGRILIDGEMIEFSKFKIPQSSIHRAVICIYSGGYSNHMCLRLVTGEGYYDFFFIRGGKIDQLFHVPVQFTNKTIIIKRTKKEIIQLIIAILLLILFTVLLFLYHAKK